MDHRHRFVEANGVRFHCAEQGDGPLVLLLHGFPECWYSWRFQLPALAAAGYRAVAPDLRGYNLTDKPRRGYDIETLVGDVLALARALEPGAGAFHLAGHDWGGMIAWQTAWRAPERVQSLIVMNAPHPSAFAQFARRSARQMLRSSYMFFFQIPRLPERLLTWRRAAAIGSSFRRSARRRGAITAEDIEVYRTAFLRPGAARCAINYYRQAFRQGREAFPSTPITVPTLLIWGEDDPVLDSRMNDGLEAWVSDLTVEYLGECGHWTQQERPGEVNQLLTDWLQRHPAQRSPARANGGFSAASAIPIIP